MTEKFVVSKLAELKAQPGQADRLRQALLVLEGHTRKETGCRRFVFFQALSSSSHFILMEEFESNEALQAHMTKSHTQDFFALGLISEVIVRDL